MIKGTNTDCRITNISVVGSLATITCLFFANNRTAEPKGVNFYLIDSGTEDKILIDPTTYWIDSINTQETSLSNVNINGYKETKITIDITNNNTSSMQDTRWLRKCYLILTDVSDLYRRPIWSSDLLNLISDAIDVPEIKNVAIYSKEVYIQELEKIEKRLYIKFKYSYKAEIDFNYTNQNLRTYVLIKSINSGELLEDITTTVQEDMLIESTRSYDKPVFVEIYTTNLKKDVLDCMTYIFRPYIKKSFGYVKTTNGVKKIYKVFVKKDKGNGGVTWLETS